MCNLYSMTSNKAAIRDLARTMRDSVGNMPPLPGIYPDYSAPIVRSGEDGERELVMARWGMPSPAFALEGKKTDPGVTNIRNTKSPHWRRWLSPEHRCLVPLTSFSENARGPDGKPLPIWFALSEERPLAFFAGIWTTWTSVRKLKEGEVTADLFGFLTTEPNAEVGAVLTKVDRSSSVAPSLPQRNLASGYYPTELARSMPGHPLRVQPAGWARTDHLLCQDQGSCA